MTANDPAIRDREGGVYPPELQSICRRSAIGVALPVDAQIAVDDGTSDEGHQDFRGPDWFLGCRQDVSISIDDIRRFAGLDGARLIASPIATMLPPMLATID